MRKASAEVQEAFGIQLKYEFFGAAVPVAEWFKALPSEEKKCKIPLIVFGPKDVG